MRLFRNATLRPGLLVLAAAVFLPSCAAAFRWPWERHEPWPSSSTGPVATLDHPRVEARFAARKAQGLAEAPFRFVAYGDQRALADGEWQRMLRRIVMIGRDEGPFDFVVDTGDIVGNGAHTDQFRFLRRRILSPLAHVPYLVALGNHEVRDNRERAARENAARFLAYLDPEISPDRMYYRKDLGAATFLFLDTNDFVYGDRGEEDECPGVLDPASRAATQLEWLREQLADSATRALIIVGMHHPLVHSSEKHREASASLWNLRTGGGLLADVLADGGVDVILTGHTHTYERFVLIRDDGREMDLVNVSGRPRDSVLWIGSEARRARDLRGGDATEWLGGEGWSGLERWEIRQEDVMLREEEANQFAVFTVHPTGELTLQVHFVEGGSWRGTRRRPEVRLH